MPDIEMRSLFIFRWRLDLKPVSAHFRSVCFRLIVPGLTIEYKENSPDYECDGDRVESGMRVGLFNPFRRIAINEAAVKLTLIDAVRPTWVRFGFGHRDGWIEVPDGDLTQEVIHA